jgi:Potential Queuosine, Q, salvage protein family
MLLVDAVRRACGRVAERARFVRIDDAALAELAERLSVEHASPHEAEPAVRAGDAESRAAFALILAAVNFGSGWWPVLRKRPGSSGYFTIASGLAEWFDAGPPRTAAALTELDAETMATILGQDPELELMELYAASLRDVGERVERSFGGSFLGVVEGDACSATAVVETLAPWPAFLDVSVYEGRSVPFFKRAQLAAADLAQVVDPPLPDVDRLTLFADNLVPHVLRTDGVLGYDDELARRIDAEEPIEHGSPEEVEIRACAVEATERLAALRSLPPATIDRILWNLGQEPRFKSRPRHRARCTAY